MIIILLFLLMNFLQNPRTELALPLLLLLFYDLSLLVLQGNLFLFLLFGQLTYLLEELVNNRIVKYIVMLSIVIESHILLNCVGGWLLVGYFDVVRCSCLAVGSCLGGLLVDWDRFNWFLCGGSLMSGRLRGSCWRWMICRCSGGWLGMRCPTRFRCMASLCSCSCMNILSRGMSGLSGCMRLLMSFSCSSGCMCGGCLCCWCWILWVRSRCGSIGMHFGCRLLMVFCSWWVGLREISLSSYHY